MTQEQPAPRILVVDDDRQFAEVMQEVLADEGYAVELCLESGQAFATAQSLLPELIILDITMPEVGGLGVLDQLATDPRTARIPVLMCTGVSPYEMPSWRVELDRRGLPVLFKPFDLRQLLAQVKALVSGPRQASARMSDAGPGS